MSTNIVLVQVVDNYGPNKFLPLAIAYQWLYACQSPQVQQQYHLLDVVIEKVDIQQWLDGLDAAPDVVAMSCYVWNWCYNEALARAIRARYPDCRVIVGGPQVSKHDVDLVRNHDWFDIAILGENETSFRRVLECLDLETITDLPGVLTRYSRTLTQPTRTQDLDQIPSPILSGFYDGIMSTYRRRYQQEFMWQVTWETMRGCPYQCSFCDIGDDYWNKTKWFDLDRLRQEIQWMSDNRIEYVSVCDSNWGIHARDADITQWLVDAKQSTGYPAVVDVTWAKNNADRVKKIVMLDHVAGTNLFRGVNFSMQSLEPAVLTRSRRFNLTHSKTVDSMRYLREQGVATFTELIWPMPGETLESFGRGLQQLVDMGQRDFLAVHPLVLTPNAPMGQPRYVAEHGIESRRVPLDTFWLRHDNAQDYIVETVDAVSATATASHRDVLQGHMIAHWLVVLFYYGWAHQVMTWLRAQGVSELEFVDCWIKHCESRQDPWLSQEHYAVQDQISRVFEHGELWGRRVPQGGDVLWEYKSSTSVLLHQQREQWQDSLLEFLQTHYPHSARRDLVEFNAVMCVDWRQTYPRHIRLSRDLALFFTGHDQEHFVVHHADIANINTEELFLHKAYHWRRKQRYWRCDIKLVE